MKTFRIEKSAEHTPVTPEQLSLINRFSRRALSENEVYVFSVILCDNDIDRDGEQFPEESLQKLGELYVGKTGVFDHNPKAENQSARIFDTRLIHDDRINALGEPLCSLKAWAYMVRCDKNTDLILEIDAGIKKEVSVGCAVEQIVCSVCGANQKASPCSHKKGKMYGGKACCHRLLNPTDAYEWSFVAVPAQKNAGVTKSAGFNESFPLEKLFEADESVSLSKADIAALKAEYGALKAMANAGEAYTDGIRRDIVKLAAFAQPDIPAALMESIAQKLEIAQLLELQKSLSKSAANVLPPSPQLGGDPEKACEADHQFMI